MMNLSVVIITRNRVDKLKRCIDSVLSNLQGAEIVVVDNGSSDGTVNYLKSTGISRCEYLDKNKGVAGARNIGVNLATRDFVMWLDDDAWVQDLNFGPIEKYFSNNPTVGIVATRLLYPNGKIQESVRSFPTVPGLIWRGLNLYKLLPSVFWYRNYVRNDTVDLEVIDWSIGACQIIRKSVFEKVGKLDEAYFFGYEDADFCLRARTQGFLTVFWQDAIIYHDYSRISSKGLNIHLLRHIYSIFRFFFKKWYRKGSKIMLY